MVINLRQNANDTSSAYGKYFAEVDAKEPLNLKGFAKHMTGHGKIADYQMCVLVLGQVVDCMTELLAQGQPVKLDGLGTFYPSVDGQKQGKDTLEKAVEAGPDAMINGIKINFSPENTKGEKLTSRAFKEQCIFEYGYVVESEVRTVNGKERRVQKKTPISYLLAPASDGNGGGNNGGSSQNGGTQSGGSQSGGSSQSATLASPTISGTTPFAETTSVSISGPDGAEIHYTTDGNTPTAESTLYSEAFTLSDTTTVKAIAIKDGESSEVASKLFTKGEGDDEMDQN
jgi:nucleoid DNA-binding protein